MTRAEGHTIGVTLFIAALGVSTLASGADKPRQTTSRQPTSRQPATAGSSRPDETVRLRGPLHEAFAQPLAGADEPGQTVSRRPGTPLDESPAPFKPNSPNTIWIPGYWGWEPADGEYLWVPGVWRVPPPGMRWVPGYWREQEAGWQWVRGFWYPLKEPRLRYLPPPPAAQEEAAPALAANEFAVPGHWSYVRGQYLWNRGFTARHKKDWVWMPSHYAWTPRGMLFLPGYWDHALNSRGFVMAPMRGAAESRTVAGPLQPKVAVNLADLPEALFRGERFGHFYFGSYFADDVAGLEPWFTSEGQPDPVFAYERWRMGGHDWAEKLAARYDRRRQDAELRPAVHFTESKSPPDARATSRTPELGLFMTSPALARVSARSAVQVGPESLPRIVQNSASARLLATQRAKFEASGAAASGETPLALYLPSPIEPLEHDRATSRVPPTTAGQFVPGVSGRQVPGASDAKLPGMSGRTLPGVDVHIPGTVAPGVIPGADTGGKLPR
ncbi:MAG TPA: YXWGXW repeat-containing protein [Pirellulales bacterium]|nr:YXWGXW repeat-containing protein [Pirellulales bacterium]